MQFLVLDDRLSSLTYYVTAITSDEPINTTERQGDATYNSCLMATAASPHCCKTALAHSRSLDWYGWHLSGMLHQRKIYAVLRTAAGLARSTAKTATPVADDHRPATVFNLGSPNATGRKDFVFLYVWTVCTFSEASP